MSTRTTPRTPEPGTRHPNRWRVLGVLAIAQFMLIVDVTVVAIALPSIEGDLGLSRQSLTWVVSAYTLTFGGLMVLGGRAADLLGPKRLVLGGLVLFTAASLWAGAAGGAAALIGARIAQGVGAAMLSPAALSTVVRLFEGEERNRALGIWSAMGGAGAAVGVLLGGLLTAGPGWPWVFWINVPIGLIVLVALASLTPRLEPAAARAGIDVLGAALITLGTGALIYALIGAGDRGWLAAGTLGAVATAVVLYAVFAVWQRLAASPLIDVALLARRPVAAGVVVIGVATALMVGIFFLGSFSLQQVADLGPLVTGLLFLPVALATMAGATVGGRMVGTVGARRLGLGGTTLAAVGLAVPAALPGVASTVLGISLAAAGIGALFLVASATALGQVEAHEAGVASGVLSTFHEFGASIGAALVSGVAAASLVAGTGSGFDQAFVAAAVVAAVSVPAVALLIPQRQD